MRRSRRSGGSASEFGSSGEDSFVAVVVTKLTGALLFILLLTMVIMALLPKAVDLGQPDQGQADATAGSEPAPLRITTPTTLPDAIAGRQYLVALAATGGRGTARWSALRCTSPMAPSRRGQRSTFRHTRRGEGRTALALVSGERRREHRQPVEPARRIARAGVGRAAIVVAAAAVGCAMAVVAGAGGGFLVDLARPPPGYEPPRPDGTLFDGQEPLDSR